MKIIKVSSGKPEFNNLLLRQTSGMSGVWGDCKFILNSEIKKCDWWFVLHGSGLIKNEECLCDPNHIVYVSMEPNETMSKVSNNFLEQFFFRGFSRKFNFNRFNIVRLCCPYLIFNINITFIPNIVKYSILIINYRYFKFNIFLYKKIICINTVA